MEVEPHELLSRGVAGDGKRAGHCWRYFHNVALQKERGVSVKDELQFARTSFGCKWISLLCHGMCALTSICRSF